MDVAHTVYDRGDCKETPGDHLRQSEMSVDYRERME